MDPKLFAEVLDRRVESVRNRAKKIVLASHTETRKVHYVLRNTHRVENMNNIKTEE